MIRGGSIADSGWQDTSYYSWIFSPETEQFRYHSSKQRKVYDACTRESIMERRPKWTIFSPFFNEGGREKTYGGERASGGKRRRRKVVEEAPRISISTPEYYTRFYLIEPVLLLSRVFLFLGLFEDSVIEDVATPSPEKNVFEAMSRFSFTIARTLGVHEDRVPRGWKWGEKRLLNLTAINGNIEFRGASRSYGARIRESSSSSLLFRQRWTEKKKGVWITRRWHIVTRGHVSSAGRYSSSRAEERTNVTFKSKSQT